MHSRKPDKLGKTISELATHIMIDGAKALCNSRGVPFMVRRSGDADRGTMLIALLDLRGNAKLYRQERNLDFELCWRAYPDTGPMPERDAEDEIRKALKGDPDQWIVEIEDREMRFPFQGPSFDAVSL